MTDDATLVDPDEDAPEPGDEPDPAAEQPPEIGDVGEAPHE